MGPTASGVRGPVSRSWRRRLLYLLLVLTSVCLAWPSGAGGLVPNRGRDAVITGPDTALHRSGGRASHPPTITGFSPTSAPVGATVGISGSGFSDTTAVSLNGREAKFTAISATLLRMTVPDGATTGRITVTTRTGKCTSTASFTVIATPAVTGFTPASGPVGTSVSILGRSLAGATKVTFNGRSASFSVTGSTRITATVPGGATSGPIEVMTPFGPATSSSSFTVRSAPSIRSLAPTEGPVRTVVTLTGTGFTGAKRVTFNGASSTFTVRSDTQLVATVPTGATTGQVVVTTPRGTSTSSARYTVTPPPTVSSFTPSSGPVGTSVTIRGGGFIGTTSVKFNGTQATYRIVDKAQITATVPAGATTGRIVVTNPGGTSTSATSFTVAKAPTITGFSPTSGPVLTKVTISGTGFTGATAVAFNGTKAAVFSVTSSTQIAATVPSGATSGPLSVTAPGGTAASSGSFTVIATPSLSSFTPDTGPAGTVVTLVGSALSGATAVTFNGLGAAFTVVSPTQVTATVPAGATTGPIAITTRGGKATSASSFTVIPTPVIARLNRRSATRGATVIVGGSGFGDVRGASSVEFGSKPCTTYVSWSPTQIACKVPSTASLGTVKVTVVTAGGTSNAVGCKVKK